MLSANVLQWSNYFLGKQLESRVLNLYRPKPGDFDIWSSIFSSSETAPEVLELTEHPSDFFRAETDLALQIPQAQQTEFFYTMKNGTGVPNCPAQFLYFVKQIYSKYKVCNMIGPLLPYPVSNQVCCSDYFGLGYTGVAVLQNFINPNYQPLTSQRMIVRCGDWYEAYIPCVETVVALPIAAGEQLLSEDLHQVDFRAGIGFMLYDKPFRTLNGVPKEVNGFHDLRGPLHPNP